MQFCHSQVYLRRYTAAFFFTCFPSFLFLFTLTEDYGTCYGEGVLWVLKSMKIIGFSGSTRSVSFWNRVVWEGAVRAGDAAAGRGGSAQWDVITHLEGWCLVLCLPLLSWAAEPGAALVEDF